MNFAAYIFKKKNLIEDAAYFAAFAVCIGFCAYATVYPQSIKDSLVSSLTLCFGTLIPSMFPFLFISSFLSTSGLLGVRSTFLDKISYFITGLPFCALGVIFLGFIGGYPVGAKTALQLHEKGSLTENQTKRLLLFCVCPGPAFPISVVGLTLLGSKKAGIILYISVVLSNMIVGLLTRFIFTTEKVFINSTEKKNIGASFVLSGRKACESLINICGSVLVFSCIDSFLGLFISDSDCGAYLSGMLEVTAGCVRLSQTGNLPLLAGVIAFGGFSVHLQVADCIKEIDLGYGKFFASRAMSAAFSVLLCYLLLFISPLETDVLSNFGTVTVSLSQISFPVSAAMLLTCSMFLIGDHTIKKRKCRFTIEALQNKKIRDG